MDSEVRPEAHLDTYAAEVVRAIFRWKLAGFSQNRIAKKLNDKGVLCPMEYKLSLGVKVQTNFRVHKQAKWSPVTVTRILTNEIYTGVLLQGKSSTPNYKVKKRFRKDRTEWIRVEKSHEAIVSPGEFQTVQALLQKDTRTSPEAETLYPLAGMIVCGDCGQNMVRKIVPSKNKRYVYYVCSTHKAKLCCSSHSISEKILEDVVLQATVSGAGALNQNMSSASEAGAPDQNTSSASGAETLDKNPAHPSGSGKGEASSGFCGWGQRRRKKFLEKVYCDRRYSDEQIALIQEADKAGISLSGLKELCDPKISLGNMQVMLSYMKR